MIVKFWGSSKPALNRIFRENVFEDEQIVNSRSRQSYDLMDEYFWGSVRICKICKILYSQKLVPLPLLRVYMYLCKQGCHKVVECHHNLIKLKRESYNHYKCLVYVGFDMQVYSRICRAPNCDIEIVHDTFKSCPMCNLV